MAMGWARTLAMLGAVVVLFGPWGGAMAAPQEVPDEAESSPKTEDAEDVEAANEQAQTPEATAEPPAPQGPTDEEVERTLADPGTDVQQATDLGNALFDATRYILAERAWLRALELSADASLWVAVAEAREQQGALSETVAALNAYLAARPEAPDEPAIRTRLAVLNEAIEVQRAQEPVDTVPGATPQPVGNDAGQESGAPGPPAGAADGAAASEPDDPQRIRTAVWAIGAVGAAALVAGTVLGFTAVQQENKFRDDPTRARANRSDRLSIGADFAFGVAGVSAVTALVLFLTTRKKKTPPAQAIVPRITTQHVGLEAKVMF